LQIPALRDIQRIQRMLGHWCWVGLSPSDGRAVHAPSSWHWTVRKTCREWLDTEAFAYKVTMQQCSILPVSVMTS